jgi:PqqD family protein of HPr-rel-A system
LRPATFDVDDKWWIPCADALEWRSWDEEIVLYDDRSDETLHFDIATTAVFETLAAIPASVRELATVLADKLQVQADGELTRMVAQIIRMLHDKRIIAVTSPGRDAAYFH